METNVVYVPTVLMKFHDIFEHYQVKAGLSALEDAMEAGYEDFKVIYHLEQVLWCFFFF